MAAKGRRELLDQPSATAFPQSLLVCRTTDQRGGTVTSANADCEAGALAAEAAAAVPRSEVLHKVKDFLGVIAKANDKLELDVRRRSRADYDVEVLSGNEKAYIEMDLLLGVADLHNDEAVAAAEAAMSGVPPPTIPSAGDSSSDADDDSSGEMEASCGSEKKRKRKERPKIIVLDPSSNQS
ncbi:uncharacterized protein LOC122045687 [Zingiber officinale]|uniref:Uncharacterized protein n=1 Tax=Zingiber officinale TaxID=94328 RepID=A0A8J5IAX6_ZINOF|nr:uncharacterized protein LOC122045687 [Zingiber officinale]KAG6530764.1 hypothetical protein ZIOFF_004522 [Zingiber officinale]